MMKGKTILVTVLSSLILSGCGVVGPFKAYPGESQDSENLSRVTIALYESGPTAGDNYASAMGLLVDNEPYSSFFASKAALENRPFLVLPGKRSIKVHVEYGQNNCRITSHPYFNGVTVNPGLTDECHPEPDDHFDCTINFTAAKNTSYEVQISESGTIRGSRKVSVGVANHETGMAIQSGGSCIKN